MAIKLMEIWIIGHAGLTYVHIQNKEVKKKIQKVDPILFSGFLTAIETMSSSSIESIKMKDSKILIIHESDPNVFFVVGRARMKDKDKNVKKILMKIRDDFKIEFQEILKGWIGDQSIFSYYKKILKKTYFL